MVYLLHAYFGRDGREEADMMLQRHSGDPDKPRILGAFNEKTPDWLSFFFFTYFTDRDGKYQLASLAESGFDPLSRTCRFMLTEEAHHMFVGETGVGRVIQRTCELMREHKTDDVRRYGGIDLATLQRFLNFHFSVSTDLFGSELSSNAATYFTTGMKGRYDEEKIKDDHRIKEATYGVTELKGDGFATVAEPALNAINERLRDDYIEDCDRGVRRWNKIIASHGIDFELKLPHRAFNRQIGAFAGLAVTPDGKLTDAGTWAKMRDKWLPTGDDYAFVASLMKPERTPGKFAGWIAPPARGINGQPVDFEYVRFAS
jgi:benzoyl-CoA 2,3-dioxygenase component B